MSNGRILVDALEAARAPGRRRFTIAHELAHLVLHDDHVEPRLRRPVSRESAARIAPTADLGCPAALAYPPQELEANQFAAAMLMPADHLAAAGIECPLELADLCRVSLAAAEKRLDSFAGGGRAPAVTILSSDAPPPRDPRSTRLPAAPWRRLRRLARRQFQSAQPIPLLAAEPCR
jgi:hypothetical protein